MSNSKNINKVYGSSVTGDYKPTKDEIRVVNKAWQIAVQNARKAMNRKERRRQKRQSHARG